MIRDRFFAAAAGAVAVAVVVCPVSNGFEFVFVYFVGGGGRGLVIVMFVCCMGLNQIVCLLSSLIGRRMVFFYIVCLLYHTGTVFFVFRDFCVKSKTLAEGEKGRGEGCRRGRGLDGVDSYVLSFVWFYFFACSKAGLD